MSHINTVNDHIYTQHDLPEIIPHSSNTAYKTNVAYPILSSKDCFSDNQLYEQNQKLSIRFDVSLDAPIAINQKIGEPNLTYLNKGQFYNIILSDKNKLDEQIKSTIYITFHEKNYREDSSNYWKFWLAQKENIDNPKAIELDKVRSTGVYSIEENKYDSISFSWNSKVGTSIYICFNCLSTDFSRIKGVKGVPLRLQIQSQPINPISIAEITFCRIKLFRDKGAERKSKDDVKHMKRRLSKVTDGKNTLPNLICPTTIPATFFTEIASSNESNQNCQYPTKAFVKQVKAIQVTGTQPSSNCSAILEYNSSYNLMHQFSVPKRKQSIHELCILVQFHLNDALQAIYLDYLTLNEFITKVSQYILIQKPIHQVLRKVFRKTKKLIVKVDDEVIQAMYDQQLIQLEVEDNINTINLILKF